MRPVFLSLLLVACTGTPPAEEPVEEPTPGRVLPRAHFGAEPRITVYPKVELIPSNALQFRLYPDDAQSVRGPVFAIFEVRGDELHERLDVLPRWHWNGDGTRVRIEPKDLTPGAPYLLTAETLTGPGGPYAAWAKPFRVIGPDTKAPDGSRLRVEGAPVPGSSAPLTIHFAEPMHEASVHSVATLVDGAARPEAWSLSEDQQTMTFTPGAPWPAGDIRVSVGPNLRDIAGNPIANMGERLLQPQVRLE